MTSYPERYLDRLTAGHDLSQYLERLISDQARQLADRVEAACARALSAGRGVAVVKDGATYAILVTNLVPAGEIVECDTLAAWLTYASARVGLGGPPVITDENGVAP